MKTRTPLAAAIAVLLSALPAARAQQLYLDLNTGFVSGFGTGSGTYNWGDALWSGNFSGTSGTGPWIANDAAFFGAGGTYTMSLGASAFTVGGLIFNDGGVTIGNGTSGTLALSAIATATADVASGRTAMINAAISGGSGTTFSKIGTGLLVLGGNNTFAGPLSIGAGTLQLGASQRIANTVPVNVASGATFDLAGFGETIGGLSGAGAVTLGSGLLSVDPGSGVTSTFDGQISGSGGLNKGGAGTLVLNGNQAFTGALAIFAGDVTLNGTLATTTLNVNAGTLRLGASNRLADTSTVAIGGSATFDLNGYTETIGGLSGVGTVDLERGVHFISGDLIVDSQAAPSDFAGRITGFGSLTKRGFELLTLRGTNNDYDGPTKIEAGTLSVGAAGAIPDGSAVTISAGATLQLAEGVVETVGSLAGGGVVELSNGGSQLIAGGNNTSTAFSGDVNGAGSLRKTGSGTLTLSGGGSYAGITVVGGVVLANSDAPLGYIFDPLTLDGGTFRFGAAFSLNPNRPLTLGAGGGTVDTNSFNPTISHAITGSGGLTKVGFGTLTLTGASTYAGATNISSNGSIQTGASEVLPDTTAVVLSNNTALNISGGFTETIGSLSGSGQVQVGGSVLRVGLDNTSTTFSGNIYGNGSITKLGGGTLTLGGTVGNYIGGTTLGGGVLAISSDANLGSGVSGYGRVIFDGGTLRLLAAFNLNATRTLTLNAGGGTVDTNGFNTTISQRIDGGGVLRKIGSGTLTFGGNYAGGTTVSVGTLLVSGLIVGGTTVQSGGALGGTGTLGAVSVQSGGTLAPGSGGAGTLAVSGTLTLGGGSLLNLELAGAASSDEIALTGGFAAGGITTVNITGLAGFGSGTYPLITGAGGISAGSFTLGAKPGGHLYALVASGGTLSLVVDGIEAWRLAHFGSTQNSGSAADAADPDGDGWSNLQEFISGTDPNDRASVLKISQMQVVGNDGLVSFPTLLGKTYRLERSGTLQSGSWQTVQGNLPGTGGSVQITDAGGASQPQRFYRIAVQSAGP